MIKKITVIVVLILLFVCITSFGFKKDSYIERIVSKNITDICFVVSENNFNNNFINSNSVKTIKTNGKVFNHVSVSNFKKLIKENYDYIEFSYLNETLNFFYEALNLKILKKESIGKTNIYYCYCCNLKKCIYLDGFKINFQIIQNSNFMKVGYPLIYSSY